MALRLIRLFFLVPVSAATADVGLNSTSTDGFNFSEGNSTGLSIYYDPPCRHGQVVRRHTLGRLKSDQAMTCSCKWPREPRADPRGGTDCVLPDCAQGNYSFETGACACEAGWAQASILRPWGFWQGSCSQYLCKSNDVCEQVLGIAGATCPVAGWSCDCGLWLSLDLKGPHECMGPWWAMVAKATQWFVAAFRLLWLPTLGIAICMLPCGKNVIGSSERYSSRLLRDDVAWSVFVLKAGVWIHGLCIVSFLCFLLLWSMSVVLLALAVLACVAVLAAFTMLGNEASGSCACEGCTGGCCDAGALSCCDGGAMCESCCCIGDAAAMPANGALLYGNDACFLYSPYYYGGASTECDCFCCGCCDRSTSCGRGCTSLLVCLPCFRWLVAVAPSLPDNMLGGALGVLLGTHPLRNRHDPHSPLVRLLSRPCWSISNRSDRWRRVVFEWLHERDAADAVGAGGVEVLEARDEGGALKYGGVAVVREEGCFTTSDRIFNFDDYGNNECWICQQSAAHWDLWGSCSHAFCERCSGEMLRRQMPCPLCRVHSTLVVRRRARADPRRHRSASADGADGPEGQVLLSAAEVSQAAPHLSLAPLPQQMPPPRGGE